MRPTKKLTALNSVFSNKKKEQPAATQKAKPVSAVKVEKVKEPEVFTEEDFRFEF